MARGLSSRLPRTRAPRASGSIIASLILGSMLFGATMPAGATTRAAVVRAALPPGKINHIIVIEFENEGYETTFGPDSGPPT